LVGLATAEEFFHYEPRKINWRRYWIDQHVPGLRRWSFPVLENTRVEVYSPAHPVHLLDAATPTEKTRAGGEAGARRARTAQASGAAE
jgi:hypothetical protein